MFKRLRLLVCVGLLGVLACGKSSAPRPLQGGDTITPVVYLADPWVVGELEPIQIRFAVAQGEQSRMLNIDELAEKDYPVVQLTFFQNDRPLGEPLALPTHPDC